MLQIIGYECVTGILEMQKNHMKNEFEERLELIQLETHVQIHLRVLRGLKENQALHLSHVCSIQY